MPKSRGRKKQPNRVRRQTRPTLNSAGSAPSFEREVLMVDLSAEISPGITARLVRPEEIARFNALISLTGAEVDDYLPEVLGSADLAAVVLAGAEHGHERFRLELARRLTGAPDPNAVAVAATLPLVAVGADDEIVGALLAYPPPNVIEQYIDARPQASEKDSFQTMVSGVMGVAKLRALAVDPQWQGRGIGAGLLARFKDIYIACRYFYLYGQFRTDSGLGDFYGAQGFDVLPPGQRLDLWVVFNIDGGVFPEAGEQIFYYHRTS